MRKKTNKLIYLLIITLMGFSLACQDRLIILWDEVPDMFASIIDTADVWAPSEIINTQTTFQNDGSLEGKADIVMVIDNSGSMGGEIAAVKSYINTLSSQMESSEIDYRFVMISSKLGTLSINVPPPLGTSSRFKHLDVPVNSNSALSDIYDNYSTYSGFLRKDGILNFIIVSDDDAGDFFGFDLGYPAFKSKMQNLGKPKFTMHGIIGLYEHSDVSAIGQQYIKGIDETNGVKLDITTPASQWGSLFTQISNNIIDQMPETVYTLSSAPYIENSGYPEGSMTLSVNGIVYPPNGNWNYNSSTNSIEFINPDILNNSGTIVVNYSVVEEQPAGKVYPLSETPYIANLNKPEESFKVEINGWECNSHNTWYYNKNSNSIIFMNTSMLDDGDIVDIYYQTKL